MIRDIQFTTITDNPLEAYPCFVSDWLDGLVRDLTPCQRGLYFNLIREAVVHGPLPNDENLWRRSGAGSHKQWERNKELVLARWDYNSENNTWCYPRFLDTIRRNYEDE